MFLCQQYAFTGLPQLARPRWAHDSSLSHMMVEVGCPKWKEQATTADFLETILISSKMWRKNIISLHIYVSHQQVMWSWLQLLIKIGIDLYSGLRFAVVAFVRASKNRRNIWKLFSCSLDFSRLWRTRRRPNDSHNKGRYQSWLSVAVNLITSVLAMPIYGVERGHQQVFCS